MTAIIFNAVGLSFAENTLFDNLSVELHSGKVIAVTGSNGSGKSTFLRLAGQFIRPDAGTIQAFDNNNPIDRITFRKHVAAISPTMNLYSQLTATENLKFFAKLRGIHLTADNIDSLLDKVNLNRDAVNKTVGNFSTGMITRLKFAILLTINAKVWLLDEPCSNLDAVGKNIVLSEITTAAQNGKLILLATNDKEEADIADEIIRLPMH